MTLGPEVIARFVEASRKAQGLPATVADGETLRRIAGLIRSANERERDAA